MTNEQYEPVQIGGVIRTESFTGVNDFAYLSCEVPIAAEWLREMWPWPTNLGVRGESNSRNVA